MRLYSAVALMGLLVLSLSSTTYAQTDYFIQDFSQPVGYTSPNPNNTQFNTLGTRGGAAYTTVTGTLSMTRSGSGSSEVYFLRNTNFSPVPSTLYLEVDISVTSILQNSKEAAVFYIGESLTDTKKPKDDDIFAGFAIDFVDDVFFSISNDPKKGGGKKVTSDPFLINQTVRVIVAMNNGSTSTVYFDPRNATAPRIVLNPGTYDIWVNNVPLVSGREKAAGKSGTPMLTNFNFSFDSGRGTIVMDNLRIRDISGVLPVKLTYFNAEAINNTVELGWETAWERNSREFVVQRSRDLKEFGDIGRVMAAGEADGRRQYTFIDPMPLPGANYYRLRMVDRDGTYEFSKVKDVVVHSDQPTMLVGPNPTSGDRILFRASSVDLSGLAFTNIMGQNINFRIQQNSDGYTELIPSSVLAPGMYFLSLNQEGFRSHIKVLVQ